MTVSLRKVLVVPFAVVATVLAFAAPTNAVQLSQVAQSTVVNPKPATWTPDVTNGTVFAIGQVGGKMVLGGKFTAVKAHGGTTTYTRNNVLAFGGANGTIDMGFVPAVNGEVDAVIQGDGNTVYLAGSFTTVNGVNMRVAKLDATTGGIVSGWKPPTLNGLTTSLVLSGGRLFVGGNFTKAGTAPRGGLVALDPTTGALSSYVQVTLTGHHGTGSGVGGVGVKAFDIDPSGTSMVVIGNFTSATDGSGSYARDQVVRLNLGSAATVDPAWGTLAYTAQCFNWVYDSYVRDIHFSPDGSYFVIVATGGSGTNTDGTNSSCDTAARFESAGSGGNVRPTWLDYTGQDSLYTVAVTGTAVYVGGHERWLNNSHGYDYAGPGAVPRPGLGAMDPLTGIPLSWNPGRNPRGAGAYAVLATPAGLWVGSDTSWIGNFQYKHLRIAFFPLAGGKQLASDAVGQLPGKVFRAGGFITGSTNVLYRVNGGGPSVATTDFGPDWSADQEATSPLRNAGSNSADWSPVPQVDSTVPPGTPSSLFDSERWDPGSAGDGEEMHWAFPVAAGTSVEVRLYFANRYSGTSLPGQRVFNVSVEGTPFLTNFDIVNAAGDQTGTMRKVVVTSDGEIDIDLGHVVENPLINGIEIVKTGSPPPPPVIGDADTLFYRHVTLSNVIGASTIVDNTIPWNQVRGTFMLNGWLYYGKVDGNLYRRTFNGVNLGAESLIDPYNDPLWSNVDTSSGQTYRGAKSGLYSQLPGVTSMFFTNGRIYYTIKGDSQLHYRYFVSDAGIVGSDEFLLSDSVDWSDVAGAFISGSNLYFATKSDGVLHSVPWNGTQASGSPVVVDSTNNWATRGLFLIGD